MQQQRQNWRISTLSYILVTVVLAVLASTTNADQNSPELKNLFKQLQTSSKSQAEAIENKIWENWSVHENPEINRLMSYGKELINQRDYGKATELFTQVTEKAPDFAEGWNKLATVNFLMHDHVNSVRNIHKTLSLEPRHFGALSGMGLIFLAKGNYAAAHSAFQEVLKISPHSQSAQYYSDQIVEHLGDPT